MIWSSLHPDTRSTHNYIPEHAATWQQIFPTQPHANLRLQQVLGVAGCRKVCERLTCEDSLAQLALDVLRFVQSGWGCLGTCTV